MNEAGELQNPHQSQHNRSDLIIIRVLIANAYNLISKSEIKKTTVKRLVFFILLISIVTCTYCQTPNLTFEHFTVDDGLLANSVNDILEDKEGFLWFATNAGLNRFDGYEFKPFVRDPGDSNSIEMSQTTHIIESTEGNLWIGIYDNKFALYDKKKDRFQHYDINVLTTKFLEDRNGDLWIHSYRWLWKLKKGESDCDSIPEAGYTGGKALYMDQSGIIWIGTWDGLVKHDPEMNSYSTYHLGSTVTSFLEDDDNNFWISTLGNGLILFDRDNEKHISFQNIPGDPGSLSHNTVTAIYEDNKNNFWVGTENGLNLFDRKNGKFTRFQHDVSDPSSLSANKITDICEDRAGNIWISTTGGGVNMLRGHLNPFYHYKNDPDNPYSLSHNNVSSFFERPNGNVWVGTKGGLNLFERNSNKFIKYPPLNDEIVCGLGILEDSEGYVWVTSQGSKVTSRVLNRFRPTEDHGFTNKRTFIFAPWSIIEDSHRNVWSVSLFVFGRYDMDQDIENTYPGDDKDDSSDLKTGEINSVHEDQEKNIWISAPHGLYLYDPENDHFMQYRDEEINRIVDDKEGELILAKPNGIINYDWRNNKYTQYLDLGPITLIGAVMDDHGNFWVISPNGLYWINPKTRVTKKYDHTDGMHINQFNVWSTMKSRTGELFFGGDTGFIVFHPDSIIDDPYIPPIVITDFLLSNQSVPVKGNFGDTAKFRSPLDNAINYVEEVVLPNNQNIFSFEFAALNYNSPSQNMYKYRLDGFNEDWIYTNASNRVATYTNIDPGEYEFIVKGSNNDGLWNEEGRLIRIIILPAWWQTWWAVVIYMLATVGFLFGIVRFLLIRQNLKNKIELEHIQVLKMKKLDKMKSEFFTNISHEFRTPLTLILGPLKQLLENESDIDKHSRLSMMARNSRKLLFLVNQFLDFAKMKSGKLALQAEETDLVTFTKRRFASFESLALTRNINYQFQSDISELRVYLDKNKFEKVMVNLISNAFKFTPGGEDIIIKVKQNVSNPEVDKGHGIAEVVVKDRGIGIDRKELSNIFQRYFQVPNINSGIQTGTGIGLTMVREMVELHHGVVNVKSKKGKGSTFKIYLPLGKSHLTKKELVLVEEFTPELIYDQSFPRPITKDLPQRKLLDEDGFKHLLVIDDNADMRTYVKEILQNDFIVEEAINGSEGIERAIEHVPDLVISDIMMPVMDGIDFCHTLNRMNGLVIYQ